MKAKPKKKTAAAAAPTPHHPFKIGKAYFVRTVTMYYTGRLTNVGPQEIVLEDCSWIACTKRFSDTFKEGAFDEVEPFPDGPVIIGRGAIIDACEWPRDLPRVQK